MSQPTNANSAQERKFLFKNEDVTLRQELKLTEQQRASVRHFFTSDRTPEFIDVLPNTILVHRELAEKKFNIKSCIFITGAAPDRVFVLAAPKFCCRKPENRAALNPLYNAYVNMEKCDLKVITAVDTAPTMPADFNKLGCCMCVYRDSELLESQLFGLPCGHRACRKCWLRNSRWNLAREFCPVPCPIADCTQTLSVNRAAALLSDASLAIMIEYEWGKKLRQAGNVQCAGCKHLMQRNNFYRKVMSAGCACGCYTCVRCGQREHTSLRCGDAAVWNEIRSRENEDEAAAEAEKVWSMTREDFDECLLPVKTVNSEEFKRNLRFMRTNDRTHGRMLQRDMTMVARMLEMRRVQQLAQRKELQPTYHEYYGSMDVNQRWEHLEEYFNKGLDTIGGTKEKAVYLERTKEHVLYYYNF